VANVSAVGSTAQYAPAAPKPKKKRKVIPPKVMEIPKKTKEDYQRESNDFVNKLEAISKPDPPQLDALYQYFPNDIFTSYNSILRISRAINKETEVPDICFIGKQGHGKSTAFEAFLGLPFVPVGQEGSPEVRTLRPIIISMINNPDCEKPRITLRRDSLYIPGTAHDIEVTVSELAKQIEKRNVESDVPILIKYEHQLCLNMNLIDTPGIVVPSPEPEEEWETDSDDEQPPPTPVASPIPSTPTGASAGASGSGDGELGAGDGTGLTEPAPPPEPEETEEEKRLRREKRERERRERQIEREKNVDLNGIADVQIELAKHSHFIVVCLDEPGVGINKHHMLEIVKKADPKLDRTILCLTKFHNYLRDFTSTSDLNSHLSKVGASDIRTFYVSLVSDFVRSQYTKSTELLRHAYYNSTRLELEAFEKLKYDKRYESKIGFFTLRRYILETILKRVQDTLPEIPKRLETQRKNTENEVEIRKRLLKGLDTSSSKLREAANNYASDFLQAIEKLMVGTLEGNPAHNGQTLEEEKAQKETGDWVDSSHKIIPVNPQAWGIPNCDTKLYGRQQFERLLYEFKAVIEHVKLTEITKNDIAAATGPGQLNNVSIFAWVACDIAQKKSGELLLPLIEQLIKRAVYIVKRLDDIVDKMLFVYKKGKTDIKKAQQPAKQADKKQTGGGFGQRRGFGAPSFGGAGFSAGPAISSTPQPASQLTPLELSSFEDYPFLTRTVKDIYYKFVDTKAETCRTKCLDEFVCTRLIYWDFVGLNEDMFTHEKTDSVGLLTKITTEIFEDIRKRITKNVMLKVYNYFLCPIQSELNQIQEELVRSVSDEDLQQMFQVATTEEKLITEEHKLTKSLSVYQDRENAFSEAATKFKTTQRLGPETRSGF